MMRSNVPILAAAAVLFLALGCGPRNETASADPGAPSATAEERLAAMSATVAAAQAFSFSTSQHREVVDARGERGARELDSEVLVRRPDAVRIRRVAGDRTSLVVYDGANLSLQTDVEKVWTQVEMPPTLDETMDYIAEVYPMPMPLADLFYSDPAAAIRGEDLSGRMTGRETVGSKECDRLELETETVDVELWLEANERALPCRMALVYKSVEGSPRWTIDFYGWNLAPEIEDALFEYSPPADYRRIPMVAVMTAADEEAARAKRAESTN